MERSENDQVSVHAPGFLCSSCRAHWKNIHSDADRERLSVMFRILYGYVVAPGAVNCDIWLEPDENNPRRLGTDRFPIRDCVIGKGITHSGKCDRYPCERMDRHLATFETVVTEAREMLTPEELRDFVEPYLSRDYLTAIERE